MLIFSYVVNPYSDNLARPVKPLTSGPGPLTFDHDRRRGIANAMIAAAIVKTM